LDRIISPDQIRNRHVLDAVGLAPKAISEGVTYTYDILDFLDDQLLKKGANRMTQVVELTNLSAMAGNLLRTGIGKASGGRFEASGPHKFPDLKNLIEPEKFIEIKIAGGDRRPKGHLPKPGYHLTARYVLCTEDGKYLRGSKNKEERRVKGVRLYFWELRFGYLRQEHFTCSNTQGDSGKTANVNLAGMKQLYPIYFDGTRCPYDPGRRAYREIQDICESCHRAQ
jgi:hypothetical protein